MRYEDWDILIFPRDSKTPVREFKTACHVVPDTECAYAHGSTGLPTLTCFVPSLSSGAPFTVSLHSWANPEISRFTKSFSQHHDSATFEARIFIDGRLVAARSLARDGPWPQLFEHSFEFTRDGDCEFLKFPPFRSELLRQSYWNPSDELGRIRVIISEGYPRDSPTVPVERVKNVMAFSFQHAPLDILETAAIAWPNPTMWRRAVVSPAVTIQTFSNFEPAGSHAHSPRQRAGPGRLSVACSHDTNYSSTAPDGSSLDPSDILRSMPCTEALLQQSMNVPSPSDAAETYASREHKGPESSSRQVLAPIKVSDRHNPTRLANKTQPSRSATQANRLPSSDLNQLGDIENNLHSLQQDGEADAPRRLPQGPTNALLAGGGTPMMESLCMDGASDITSAPKTLQLDSRHQISGRLANTLTQSLLNQPVPLPVAPVQTQPTNKVKSRKENRASSSSSAGGGAPLFHNEMRKVSQSATSSIGLASTESAASTSSAGSRDASHAFSHGSSNEDEVYVAAIEKTQPPLGRLDEQAINKARGPSFRSSASLAEDKGNKRTRQFTPASARAIDEEDEPRRRSPRLRMVSNTADAEDL